MPADDRILSPNVFEHPLRVDPVDPASVAAGDPRIAASTLAEDAGSELGLWEITEGTVTDVEVDEVFIVLRGDATLTIEGEGVVQLDPGVAVRLKAGDRTVWEIREPLRKIYLA